MREGASLDRFKQGVSRDLRRGTRKLSPQLVMGLKAALLAIGALMGTGLLLLVIIEIPQWQAASWEGRITNSNDIAKLETDTRTTVVQALGGIVLLIGLYFTAKTLRTTQEGQITDRFTKAIDQLGKAGPENLAIRLGGIYALERIARDSEKDYWPVMEILTAYVRVTAPRKEEQLSQEETTSGETQRPEPTTDIQAVLSVLGRRTRSYGQGEDRGLDLRGTNLRGAPLHEINLRGARLDRADLHQAHLYFARLEAASLREANLTKADLRGAHLVEVRLDRADLRGAIIMGADVSMAELMRADLRGTDLRGAYGLTTMQVADAITDETTMRSQDLL